jgi:hypothetical protein
MTETVNANQSTPVVWVITGTIVAVMMLSSCIPVTIHPERDAQGKPIALPVTPVGHVTPEGAMVPIYDVSDQAPAPPKDWWPLVEQGLTLALGLLAGGGVAVPIITRTRKALSLVANLADAQAQAFTPEDVEKNKKLAAQMQEAAGVRTLIQKVRGKI